MSDLTPKTNDPEIVDVCLTSNPKLTSLFTSYQDILNIFPMESLISYTNNYNKHVHDPVTAEKEFYINLNNQDETAIKLDYIDNPDIDSKTLASDEYWSSTGTLDEIKETYYSGTPNDLFQLPSDNKDTQANLKKTLDKDVQFILFWVEKFRCIHETVKAEIFAEIPKDTTGQLYNKDNVYFNNFNESLFHLRDSVFIKDRTTSLWVDKNNVMGAPSVYNRCQMNNIDSDTYDTASELSDKSSRKFQANMVNICADLKKDAKNVTTYHEFPSEKTGIQYTSSMTNDSIYVDPDSGHSHGNNAVVDNKHPVRIKENLDAVQAIMNETLGDMKRVFDFLDKNTRDNNDVWGKYARYYYVEGTFKRVDQFATELKVLGENIPLSTRGNHTLS